MITFWADEPGVLGFENYLRTRGEPIRDRFVVRRYRWEEPVIEVAGGPHIFGAVDQLGSAELHAVGVVVDQLTALQPGVPLLNDPRRCLLRPALLDLLTQQGINRFRTYTARDPDRVAHFPVFVRGALDHEGSLSPLLRSPDEVRKALRALRVRGRRLADLLLVEFCDTSDSAGVFRKYSAFRVGERIVPIQVMAGTDWMVKSGSSQPSVEQAREEVQYVAENPHADWLRRVFALAGTEYGRMDYGVFGTTPQAWEINLSPTIGRPPNLPARTMTPEVAELRERSRLIAHGNLRAAFAELDPAGGPSTFRLTLDPALLATIARESARRAQRRATWGVLGRIYHYPTAGAPIRALVDHFFPRN